jgi:hypothetical protein
MKTDNGILILLHYLRVTDHFYEIFRIENDGNPSDVYEELNNKYYAMRTACIIRDQELFIQ